MGYGIKSFSTPELHSLFAGVQADRLKLPEKEGEPGAWCEAEGEIEPCRAGWHDSPTFAALIQGGFLGPLIALVEHDGESVVASDGHKAAHRRMRYVRDLGWTPELCVEYCEYLKKLAEQIVDGNEPLPDEPVKLMAKFVFEKCGSPAEVPAW